MVDNFKNIEPQLNKYGSYKKMKVLTKDKTRVKTRSYQYA